MISLRSSIIYSIPLVIIAALSLSNALPLHPDRQLPRRIQIRALDSLDGMDFGFKKRALNYGIMTKRALDSLEGDGFGLKKRAIADTTFDAMTKKALDSLEGTEFGLKKRASEGATFDVMRTKKALDVLDGEDFGLKKRSFNSDLDGIDFDGTPFVMTKKALDMLDGEGFGLKKRSSYSAPSGRNYNIIIGLRRIGLRNLGRFRRALDGSDFSSLPKSSNLQQTYLL